MKKTNVQPGTKQANKRYFVEVLENGPYLIHGSPPFSIEKIITDDDGMPWGFEHVRMLKSEEPMALCRCGDSKNKPFCDGAHLTTEWDLEPSASEEPLLEGAQVFEGPESGVDLTDNIDYCVYARICDAKGRVWKLVGKSDNEAVRDTVVHEANMCPGGRLSAWNKRTGKPIEPKYEPSIVLIEDVPLMVSGGIWVRGGIAVIRSDGFTYEIRNRAMLCRCGASSNKPWCDGAHASIKFQDELFEFKKEKTR